jgi:hypothetical protein
MERTMGPSKDLQMMELLRQSQLRSGVGIDGERGIPPPPLHANWHSKIFEGSSARKPQN